MKDYYEAREWLESYIPQTYSRKNLGLERIEFLLKLLGNPQKKFKSIHVGGTSGKGSTAFYISKILTLKKYKVGLHLSPHLIYLGERMQINGKEISVSKFVELINKIKPFVEQMRGSQVGTPSYFEILVAVSFKYFAEEKVDWAVVEVGLGGKFDATNVLIPKASVITNIGLDHTDILGKTVEKIAREKSGIIKGNSIVITGAAGKSMRIIKKAAKSKKSKLITLDTQFIKNLPNIDILASSNIYKEAFRSTQAKLVFSSEILAILTISSLKIPIYSKLLKTAFVSSLSGRFEEVDNGIILDGAHNPDKIRYILELFMPKKVILVLAFKKGKEWKRMVDLLLKNLPLGKVVATEFSAVTDTGKFTTVRASKIKKYVESMSRVKVVSQDNSQEAVFEALNDKKSAETILVTGSLFLVGEARTLWYQPSF